MDSERETHEINEEEKGDSGSFVCFSWLLGVLAVQTGLGVMEPRRAGREAPVAEGTFEGRPCKVS